MMSKTTLRQKQTAPSAPEMALDDHQPGLVRTLGKRHRRPQLVWPTEVARASWALGVCPVRQGCREMFNIRLSGKKRRIT